MRDNLNLHGYIGQPATYTLADGRELPAGELVDLAFDAYVGDSPTEQQLGVAAATWNGLTDAQRQAKCEEQLEAMNATAEANAKATDVAAVLGTVGETVSRNLFAELIDAGLQELKSLQKPWAQLSQRQQQEVLERLTARVKSVGSDLIRDLATRMHPSVVCELEQVTVKKDAKATLAIPKGEIDQDLLDAVGGPVLLVVCSLAEIKEMQAPLADPDQAALPFGSSAPNISEDGNGGGEPDDGTAQHSDPED